MQIDIFSHAIAQIKQASLQRRPSVVIRNVRLLQTTLLLLIKLGFIHSFHIIDSRRIQVFLKYDEYNRPALRSIQRVSKPGSRVYINYKSLQMFAKNNNINDSYQIPVISSPNGIITGQMALKLRVGGELLFILS